MRLMNPMIAVLTLGMAFAATGAALSQPHASGMSPERLERVTAVLDKDIADGAIAGIVSLIYRHGEIAHLRARGFQDVDARTPMRRDTIFGLASMTKPVTAVAVMMLVEEGALGLDEPVDHWLPELANRKALNDPTGPLDAVHDAPRPITVRDLLRYTMGLGLQITTQRLNLGPSVGSFWWHGATGVGWTVDPHEDMIFLRFVQHGGALSGLSNYMQAVYQAIVD